MRTYDMVRVHTVRPPTGRDIPASCSSKTLLSWIFLRQFHPVPREQVWSEALHHMPQNVMTYTCRHAPRVVLTRSMSLKRKMVLPMRNAETWRWSKSCRQNVSGRSIELI